MRDELWALLAHQPGTDVALAGRLLAGRTATAHDLGQIPITDRRWLLCRIHQPALHAQGTQPPTAAAAAHTVSPADADTKSRRTRR